MKKTLTLGSIVLGCCLVALAQTSGQKTTVQGCLTQSADGAFFLADASANSYQLNDSASRLGQFVGKEIRVDGVGFLTSERPGAMAAPLLEFKAPAQQIDVTRVRKVADNCQPPAGSR